MTNDKGNNIFIQCLMCVGWNRNISSDLQKHAPQILNICFGRPSLAWNIRLLKHELKVLYSKVVHQNCNSSS